MAMIRHLYCLNEKCDNSIPIMVAAETTDAQINEKLYFCCDHCINEYLTEQGYHA